jgi:cysteinyl-tRNA synthetase
LQLKRPPPPPTGGQPTPFFRAQKSTTCRPFANRVLRVARLRPKIRGQNTIINYDKRGRAVLIVAALLLITTDVMVPKVLKLYNTYSRCIKEARLSNNQLIQTTRCTGATPTQASLYICGPTVYSESHLGHALTYTRADLFRRVLKSLFGLQLTTVMNITDIDDKILAKTKETHGSTPPGTTNPSEHPFNQVAQKYYKSFVDDMKYIRVLPPDLTIKVSNQVNLIANYVRNLETAGHAYLAPNGDVYFDVSSVPNYKGRIDERRDKNQLASDVKRDIRDFALWKAAKPGEPIWSYKSDVTGREIRGRPGWHVQCSAICSAIFGDQLDFHYGGKDLIFPHHYNEQACCCAFHRLDTSKDFHVWSKNWLHSGHLVLRDEKMSKSLGNVVDIRTFINETSINALRLLCIATHYRADVNFDSDLLSNMRSLDHRISAFISYVNDEMSKINETQLDDLERAHVIDLEGAVHKVREDISDGVCEDFDLSKGLHSILDLSKVVYGAGSGNLKPIDIVRIRHMLVDWCSMCGLEYGSTKEALDDQALLKLIREFRQETRDLVVHEMRRRKERAEGRHDGGPQAEDDNSFLESLLINCDRVRARMNELGFVIRDKKT